MTDADLDTLKSNIDKLVRIKTMDGEQMIAKVISAFADDSDADMFFELVSTSRPELYAKNERVGGYSLPLKYIASVRAATNCVTGNDGQKRRDTQKSMQD